jgi:hypothetical protein
LSSLFFKSLRDKTAEKPGFDPTVSCSCHWPLGLHGLAAFHQIESRCATKPPKSPVSIQQFPAPVTRLPACTALVAFDPINCRLPRLRSGIPPGQSNL